MQKKLALYVNHLPEKTRCCDQFEVDNKVRVLSEALRRRYLGLNDFNSLRWLSYDIDRPTTPDELSEDKLAPSPTLFVSNPKNRHAHVLYLLETPVHNNLESSQKALRFAAAVDAGLALKLDADLGYNGLLSKNAAHEAWEVLPSYGETYTLHELAESVDTSVLNDLRNDPMDYGLGRNCILFNELRLWAYKAIRQGWPAWEQWHQAVLQRTEMLNIQFQTPMSFNERKHIAKSVSKWTYANFSEAGFSQWQSKQGTKGGKAKGQAYGEKRSEALKMYSDGMSFNEISKVLKCSPRTISNWAKYCI